MDRAERQKYNKKVKLAALQALDEVLVWESKSWTELEQFRLHGMQVIL